MGEFTIIKGGLDTITRRDKKNDTLKKKWFKYAMSCNNLPESEEKYVKYVFAHIKFVNMQWDSFDGTNQMAYDDICLTYECALRAFCGGLAHVSFKRFIQAFPVKKQYKGEENYFSTMTLLKDRDMGQPLIKEENFLDILSLLSQYQNDDIHKFVNVFAIVMNEMMSRNFLDSWSRKMRRKNMRWSFVGDNGA